MFVQIEPINFLETKLNRLPLSVLMEKPFEPLLFCCWRWRSGPFLQERMQGRQGSATGAEGAFEKHLPGGFGEGGGLELKLHCCYRSSN